MRSMAADTTYVLVTGANSGLGLGICQRLINEFLDTRPSSQCLHLVITTRSARKSTDTITILRQTANRHQKLRNVSATESSRRVVLESETLDLTKLLSVRACARRLLASRLPRIDAIILNAGIWGVHGLNWGLCIYRIMTDWVHSVTFPDFHLSATGAITGPQFPDLPEDAPKELRDAPPLAAVFTSNLFGHYVLAHELMPLLRVQGPASNGPGRIIWVSSQDALDILDFNDLEGFRASNGYENSKRITDLLALTATLPSTAKSVRSFLDPTSTSPQTSPDGTDEPSSSSDPEILVSHPGMLATNIIVLPFPLPYGWVFAMWIARWLGSPWHTISSYTAAIAPVFLALASFEVLSKMQSPSGPGGGGIGKWGSSAVGFSGTESVKRTFVTGWGLGGEVNEGPHWEHLGFGSKEKGTVDSYGRYTGRRRDSKKPTREDIQHFEEEGREVWKQLENLRVEWTKRCEVYENWIAQQ